MEKSMLIDCKQKCVLCGSAVGIFLLNPERGLKMCSNAECEWPFSEDSMQVYDFGNTRLKDINLEGPCPEPNLQLIETLVTTDHDIIDSKITSNEPSPARLNCTKDEISELTENSASINEIIEIVQNDHEQSETKCEEDINQIKNEEDESELKPLPMDDETQILHSLLRARSRLPTTSHSYGTIIKQPWMLKRLQMNYAMTHPSKKSHTRTTPKFSVNIETKNQSGIPAIEIELLPSNDLDIESNDQSTSRYSQPP